MIEYVCSNCAKKVMKYPSKAKRCKKQFCSVDCHNQYRKFKTVKQCEMCGSKWYAEDAGSNEYRRKFCSKECKNKAASMKLKGRTSRNYKGRRVTTQGYIEVFIPEHPNANSNGYYKRANLVMEKKIGRYLDRKEVIHHIDKNKQNDDLDNLMLFASNSEHISYHYFVLGDKHINNRLRKSKFSMEQMEKMRKFYRVENMNIHKISKIFNTSWGTVSEIIKESRDIYKKET
ncbi:HNH endonuclease [Paenibacillus chitinolyticus]|uniref:HNH endonuclease n=1 Tax=Paenibacillus chitinolyticus TaxID=79263 RepID=UPI0036711ED8